MLIFREYVKNKSKHLMMVLLCLLAPGVVLFLSGTSLARLILVDLLVVVIYGCFFYWEYLKYKRVRIHIEKIENELGHCYLSHELIKPPEQIEAREYYELLKLANRDMCNVLAENNQQMREYRELIEEWIHEMKTPLTSLSLLCGSEIMGGDAGYELERLKFILDKVLNYIRMDTLEKDYHVENFKICDLLHSLIMEERIAIREKKLCIDVKIKEECNVVSDIKWVRFIFKQLLNNAVKYSNRQGRLTFLQRYDNGILWIGLKDEGSGIAEEDRKRLFEKGFTGGSNQRDTASGIGLYLVKKCADKMNLQLNVVSVQGQGSLFEVGFPVSN